MRTPFLLALLFMVASSSLRGQNTYELGLFLGVSNYAGDLARSLGPRFDENGFSTGIVGRVNLNRQLSVRGNLLVGTLQGDDYNYEDRMTRGYKFQSLLAEVTAMAEWEPLGRKRFYTDARGRVNMNNLISPYLFAGAGLAFVDYDVTFSRFDPDKSQNDPLIRRDESIGSNNVVLALPVGVGVKFDFHPRFVFSLEVSARYPFSDYIDGISLAANDASRDWYYIGGATLSYRFLDGLLSTRNRWMRR